MTEENIDMVINAMRNTLWVKMMQAWPDIERIAHKDVGELNTLSEADKGLIISIFYFMSGLLRERQLETDELEKHWPT